MREIYAIFENGVFRPESPVDLPEHSRVAFELRTIDAPRENGGLDEVYAILNQKFASGQHDVAARHNEHQP